MAVDEETKIIKMMPLRRDDVYLVILKDDKGQRAWTCKDYQVAEALVERYCEEKWSELDPKAEHQPSRSDLVDEFYKLAKGQREAIIAPYGMVIDWPELYEVTF